MVDEIDDLLQEEEVIYTSEYNANLSELCNEGLNYYYGTNGYEKDLGKAYDIFMDLGREGDQDACVQLGCMYYLGHHIEKDYAEAKSWWEKAGEHDEALYGLGMIHHNGSEEDAIPQDAEKAKYYWEKASALFNEAATAALYKFYRTTETHVHVENKDVQTNSESIKKLKFEFNLMKEKHGEEVKRLTDMVGALTQLVQNMNTIVVRNKDNVDQSVEVTSKIGDQLAQIIEMSKCRCHQMVPCKGAILASGPNVVMQTQVKAKDTPREAPVLEKKKRSNVRANKRGKKNLKAYLNLMMKVKKRTFKKGKNSKSEREELLAVFKTFDTDGDGSISVEEFRKGMMTLGTHLSAKEVKALMDENDADGNGEIDYGEFVDLLLSDNPETKAQQARKAMKATANAVDAINKMQSGRLPKIKSGRSTGRK